MSERHKRMLALIVVLAALALLAGLGGATVAALTPEAIVTVCPPPGTDCDYTTIQEAVDNADSGDTIRVAQGTYTENLVIPLPITVAGGYSGPPNWTRDLTQYETTLDGSASQTVPGDWDADAIAFPRVISDTGTGQYRMWYNGQSLTYPGWGWTLGLAESPDGLDWTKASGNPVLEPGDEGEWDSAYRGQVAMMEEDGLYKMWYSGSDGGPWQTGYATSTDGVDWDIYAGNPVLTVGGGGSWDGQEADGPTVIKDGGLYKMWYHGCDADNTACSIGYATSTNGRDWSKYAGNPVLTGTGGQWDGGNVLWPSVVRDGGTYKMWYNGGGGRIGLATSLDGLNWTKEAANPVLTEGWDGQGAYAHNVLLEGGTYKMWLRSGTGGSVGIGYAESPDGIAWTMSNSNPLLAPGAPTQWGEPVVRFEGGSDGSVLDGLIITGGSAQMGGGVDAECANLTIRHCLIRDNYAYGGPDNQGGGGVAHRSGEGQLTIVDSRIVNNEASQGASGVRVGLAHLVMTNTLVANNGVAEGLHLNGSAALMNVTIAGNGTQTGRPGINFNPQTEGIVEMVNSIIHGNGDVIHVSNPNWVQSTYSDIQRGWPGTGNIDADPQFADPSNGDYHLLPWSPCIDEGTATDAPDHDLDGVSRPQNAGYDIGAYEFVGTPIQNEGTRYVATSGSNAGPNLCLDPNAPCATVEYAVSVANEGESLWIAEGTYTENLTIDGKTLTLRGGYTISDTEWLTDTGETVIDGNGADRTFLIHGNDSTLENLTITGGHTPDGECWGGGVWVTNGNVTIRDSLITGNWADCSGAGVEVNSDWGPAHLTLVDSIVFDNQSGGECGGVSVWHTGAHLTNTLIISNTGGNGSALRIEDSDVTIQNCTVADNQGSAAINAYDTDGQPDALTLRNTIAWDNTDSNLSCNIQTCAVTYSDIQGGWAGTGNIDADPEFVDPANGDYHLRTGSPCRDKGTSVGAPASDIEGTPRDAAPDMGAYEWTGFRIFLPLVMRNY